MYMYRYNVYSTKRIFNYNHVLTMNTFGQFYSIKYFQNLCSTVKFCKITEQHQIYGI